MSFRCEKGWSVKRFEAFVWDLLIRQKFLCLRCRDVFVDTKVGRSVLERHRTRRGYIATLDHIVPKAKGGTHATKNIQLLCRECNRIKGDGPLVRKRKRSDPPAWMGGWS